MTKKIIYNFNDLSKPLKDLALKLHSGKLLKYIIEDGMRFNDDLNGDDLQARIDSAIEKADKMQTPWFAHEYIMDTCKDEILGMAQYDAEDAQYSVSADGQDLYLVEYSKVKIFDE